MRVQKKSINIKIPVEVHNIGFYQPGLRKNILNKGKACLLGTKT